MLLLPALCLYVDSVVLVFHFLFWRRRVRLLSPPPRGFSLCGGVANQYLSFVRVVSRLREGGYDPPPPV